MGRNEIGRPQGAASRIISQGWGSYFMTASWVWIASTHSTCRDGMMAQFDRSCKRISVMPGGRTRTPDRPITNWMLYRLNYPGVVLRAGVAGRAINPSFEPPHIHGQPREAPAAHPQYQNRLPRGSLSVLRAGLDTGLWGTRTRFSQGAGPCGWRSLPSIRLQRVHPRRRSGHTLPWRRGDAMRAVNVTAYRRPLVNGTAYNPHRRGSPGNMERDEWIRSP